MIDKLKSRWDYKDPPREVSVEDAIECSVVGSRDYGEGELENRTALITRAKAAHEPKDKNEKLYVWESVQTCWGTDLCLLDMPRDNAVYLVRGSEMYRFVLPELPPPDPTMGTGAKSIDRMLPDKE